MFLSKKKSYSGPAALYETDYVSCIIYESVHGNWECYICIIIKNVNI